MERPINPDMLGGSLKNILASLSLSCVMESIQSKTQPAAQGANVLATSSPQASSSSATATNQNSPGKYSELLAVIEELGKDIRPTYAGSKNAAERLKKGIMHARVLVRECLVETDKCARQ